MSDPETYGRHAAVKYAIVGPKTVEPKTKAAAGGATAGSVVAGFLIWLIDTLWFGGGELDVPLPVTLFVTLVATAGLSFASSYYARHVNRLPLA
jgi:hypothetical protein